MHLLLALLSIFITNYYLLISSPALVRASYQQCETSTTCTIGEFLYNDDYTPLPGQSCTLTAKYPDGTAFLSSVAMTSRGDGWYSYDATIGTTTGLYSATICCIPSGGTMCLDKSFEVNEPVTSGTSLTAADVWNYSGRTLTSYGTLVSDIWNYSSRSLTSFGSLVSDIWGHSSRTITSFGSLVSDIWGFEDRELTASTPNPNSLQGIVAEQKTQREMLEKLVNAPIISLEIGEGEGGDLTQKLEDSRTTANNLYEAVQSTKSRLLTLEIKWNKLGNNAKTTEITEITNIWNNNPDLIALKQLWNTTIIDELEDNALKLKDTLSLTLGSTNSKTAPLTLIASLEPLSNLETTLGDITSSSTDPSFFGYLAQIEEKDSLLKSETQRLAQLIEEWDGAGEAILSKQLSESQKRILSLSPILDSKKFLLPSNDDATGKDQLKNQLFSLQGLVTLSRAQLASNSNTPVKAMWLEEGSIIFRAAISNPSKQVTQTAQVRFTLPQETKESDILTIDPNLKAAYDPNSNALVVTGSFTLPPDSLQIAAVELKDIWIISDSELSNLTIKANNLASSLQKGNLYAQGIALESEIKNTINSLNLNTKLAKPENRIRAYREAQLKIASAKASLTELENLVAMDSSNRSIVGFVGGVNTISVLGIIMVVIAGFVFMSRYFAQLNSGSSTPLNLPLSLSPLITQPEPETGLTTAPLTNKDPISWNLPRPAITFTIILVTAIATITLTRLASKPASTPSVNQVVPPNPSLTPTPTPSPSPTPNPTIQPTANEPTPSIVPPQDSSVNIRNNPNSNADIVMSLREPTEIIIFKIQGDWAQIGFTENDRLRGYWVSSQFIANQ